MDLFSLSSSSAEDRMIALEARIAADNRRIDKLIQNLNQATKDELGRIRELEKQAEAGYFLSQTEDNPAGNPTFLQQIERCIRLRAEIIGIFDQ